MNSSLNRDDVLVPRPVHFAQGERDSVANEWESECTPEPFCGRTSNRVPLFSAQLSHCIDKAARVILRVCWNEWSESGRTWIFRDLTQRISVGRYQHLGWTCCQHLEGTRQYGFTSLKTARGTRISNLQNWSAQNKFGHVYYIVLGPVSLFCSYNTWCLCLQPEADTQSHTFRCKVFKRPRPCNLCHQPIHHQGSCCRGELGIARYWSASIKPAAVLDIIGVLV